MAGLLPDPQARREFTAGCPRLPLGMFEEVHPPAPQWPDAPAAYLQLSEAYEDEAAQARGLGWPVAQQKSHHLALLTDPGLVAGSVHELLGQLRQHRQSQVRLGAEAYRGSWKRTASTQDRRGCAAAGREFAHPLR